MYLEIFRLLIPYFGSVFVIHIILSYSIRRIYENLHETNLDSINIFIYLFNIIVLLLKITWLLYIKLWTKSSIKILLYYNFISNPTFLIYRLRKYIDKLIIYYTYKNFVIWYKFILFFLSLLYFIYDALY